MMGKGSHYLLPPLGLLTLGKAAAQDVLRYRYQLYDEENGRIDVESHYLDLKYGLGQGTSLGLRLAVDSLSGMTPTGTLASSDPNDWAFTEIEDERYVSVLTIDHEIGDHTLSFEYARSEEDDYLSNALALRFRSELNEKNTTVTAGVAVALDTVKPVVGPLENDPQSKNTYDITLGISQIITPRTLLDVTLGYGHSEGYLADPYRGITEQLAFGGSFINFNSAENRPREQDRWVAKVAGRHYFPILDAALAGSYRFYANSENLEGHTFELKWIQQINEQFSVTPYVRYYQQNAAEYYTPTLTGTGIIGNNRGDGSPPFYSADYRLSALESFTYGLRLAYEANDELTMSLQLERYEMSGRSAETPAIFFPTANVISAGIQWNF